MNRFAYVVTPEDIRLYFKSPSPEPGKPKEIGWEVSEDEDGVFIIRNVVYNIALYPEEIKFSVKIEQLDDPSDSAQDVTEDPIGFIVRFLQTGTEGDAVFQKMSFSPFDVSFVLLSLASACRAGAIGQNKLVKILQRVAARLPNRTAVGQEEVHIKEIGKLMEVMNSKGWRTKPIVRDDTPGISVNINDIFAAEIFVDSISWSYRFEVYDAPGTEEEGHTDDPIQQYRKYYKRPDIQEAKSKLLKIHKIPEPEPGAEPTKRHGPKRKEEETPPELFV
jgi:hypothetical protein